jgi:ABC-type sugar transport system permease subunit
VAVIHMWKGFGWGFVIFLAGLQTIPPELYEAATVDGASAWAQFRHITVPLLLPVCVVVSVLTILGTMQIYDLIVATTQGGPAYHTEVPITRIMASMLGSSRLGYAAAQGIVFGLILLAVSLVQMRLSRRMDRATT